FNNSPRRATTSAVTPSAARTRATSRPIPTLHPVTIAVRPRSSRSIPASLRLGDCPVSEPPRQGGADRCTIPSTYACGGDMSQRLSLASAVVLSLILLGSRLAAPALAAEGQVT